MLMAAYPYSTTEEIHGLSFNYVARKVRGKYRNFVTRATVFGGRPHVIQVIHEMLQKLVAESLDLGFAGTEESYYTILAHTASPLFWIFPLPSGDISPMLTS